MTSLRALTLALVAAGCLSVAHAQVRPEVGKPLQQASELLKAGKAKEALAKIREADAVGGKSAQEQLTIDRMRGSAAQRAGDLRGAVIVHHQRRRAVGIEREEDGLAVGGVVRLREDEAHDALGRRGRGLHGVGVLEGASALDGIPGSGSIVPSRATRSWSDSSK